MGGGARSFMSGRVSFAFDLRGPSVSVDSACSSGLSALHLAYQSVRSGENALAVAGGVNMVTSPAETIPFSQAGMLAPDGRCKFGSATADGFVRSEGVAVVVLKPLAPGRGGRRRDPRGDLWSAMGNDGQSEGYLMTPSQLGQEETLRAAYADAGVPAGQVDYVEAHGTGTPAGDPVELGALDAVIGAEPARRTPVPGRLGEVQHRAHRGGGRAGRAHQGGAGPAAPARSRATCTSDELTAGRLGRPAAAARTRDHRVAADRRAPAWPASARSASPARTRTWCSASAAGRARGAAGDVTPEAELLPLSAPDPDGLTALATRYADFLERTATAATCAFATSASAPPPAASTTRAG